MLISVTDIKKIFVLTHMNLKKYPFFTAKMLKAFENVPHPEVTISRNKHKFITIEKGKYTVHENPLVYATTLITPSYVSFRTALNYYQLTNQIPLKIEVVTKKRKTPLSQITFIQSPHLFGYTKTTIEGFDLFIAEPEKLLIDCLLYPKQGVSTEELKELIKQPLENKKIITYLKQINNINLVKKTGYLLQSKEIYEVLQKEIQENKNYPKLEPNLPKSKNNNKKWRINSND